MHTSRVKSRALFLVAGLSDKFEIDSKLLTDRFGCVCEFFIVSLIRLPKLNFGRVFRYYICDPPR